MARILTVEPPSGNFTYDEQSTFVGKIAIYLSGATVNVAMSARNPYYRASSDLLLQRMGKERLTLQFCASGQKPDC
ncbi:hypothetical protein, partial [Pseudomonas umsongensis]|uniref:hypothetical protein n=1 Tax=Pseudomonas umsongensis TaxID=198618 RepID=UPI00200B04C1